MWTILLPTTAVCILAACSASPVPTEVMKHHLDNSFLSHPEGPLVNFQIDSQSKNNFEVVEPRHPEKRSPLVLKKKCIPLKFIPVLKIGLIPICKKKKKVKLLKKKPFLKKAIKKPFIIKKPLKIASPKFPPTPKKSPLLVGPLAVKKAGPLAVKGSKVALPVGGIGLAGLGLTSLPGALPSLPALGGKKSLPALGLPGVGLPPVPPAALALGLPALGLLKQSQLGGSNGGRGSGRRGHQSGGSHRNGSSHSRAKEQTTTTTTTTTTRAPTEEEIEAALEAQAAIEDAQATINEAQAALADTLAALRGG